MNLETIERNLTAKIGAYTLNDRIAAYATYTPEEQKQIVVELNEREAYKQRNGKSRPSAPTLSDAEKLIIKQKKRKRELYNAHRNGKLGGRPKGSTSARSVAASQRNGALGGRPCKSQPARGTTSV